MSLLSVVSAYEREALLGIPVEAQLIYAFGLKTYMNYNTLIVGGPQRRISYLMLAELIEVWPHQGMKGVRPDKSKVRRLMDWLERRGLIERIEDPEGYLVLFLPLAKRDGHPDAHFSAQEKADTNKTASTTSLKARQNKDYSIGELSTRRPKADTHRITNIEKQKTTTPTPPKNRQVASMADSVVGGGDSDELSEPAKHATQSPQTIATPRQSSHTAAQTIKSASWEEKLIFPDGLRDRDKTAIFHHLHRCPAAQRQAIVDELAARLGSVKAPSGYVRKLVDCALSGEFIPEAGIPLAEARERRKNDFQSPLPTRKPAPSEEVSAEIERLTAEMVAAQRAGDFKQFSRLGAQVGRLG